MLVSKHGDFHSNQWNIKCQALLQHVDPTLALDVKGSHVDIGCFLTRQPRPNKESPIQQKIFLKSIYMRTIEEDPQFLPLASVHSCTCSAHAMHRYSVPKVFVSITSYTTILKSNN